MNKKSYIAMIIALVILVIMLPFFISGDTSSRYNIYFVTNRNQIEGEMRNLGENTPKDLLERFRHELNKGPSKEGSSNVLSQDVKIKSINLNESELELDFTENYYDLEGYEKILYRTAVMKTYAQLSYIESFSLMVEDSGMIGEYGKILEKVSKGDVITFVYERNTSGKSITVKLYFSDKEGGLKAEERLVENQAQNSFARSVVEELIKGPTDTILASTIPVETKIKGIEIRDEICYLDLSKEFVTKHPGGELGETLTIYSVVNTLTEISNISRVQFLIDGEKLAEYKGNYVFNLPFGRYEMIIRH